jgi:hypothetical protein
MPDPLSLPEAGPSGKRRSLAKKHKLLYAPLSDIESVLVDADAVYIDIAQHKIQFSDAAGMDAVRHIIVISKHCNFVIIIGEVADDKALGEGVQMVRAMQKGGVSLDERAGGDLRLLAGEV